MTSDDLFGTARQRVREAIRVLVLVDEVLGPEAGAIADLRIDALRAVVHGLSRDLVQLRGPRTPTQRPHNAERTPTRSDAL